MAVQDLKYHELTDKIIGCAMKVHRFFGPGFPEIVYEKALLIELKRNNIECSRQVEKDIFYEGEWIYKRRLDIMVEDIVLTELKAIRELDTGDQNQIINYLRVFGLEVGLLLNFGTPSLQFKRFINTLVNP